MVIHTEVSAALYCPACGGISVLQLNQFIPVGASWKSVYCGCGQYIGSVRHIQENLWLLKHSCSFCNQKHYTLINSRFLRTLHQVNRIYCTNYYAELGYCGTSAVVAAYIGRQRCNYSRLLFEWGIKDDPGIMLAGYNRITDMLAAGNITCSCSKQHIIIYFDSGAIVLQCENCGRRRRIVSHGGKDIFSLQKSRAIVLTKFGLPG